MAQNQRQSPRQKMINLMYIVLTAMLALNVSSDVLGGFTEVGESVKRTADNATLRNKELIDELGAFASHNHEKGDEWYRKARIVKSQADSLWNVIESLKYEIAIETDGKEANVYDLKSGENLDAAPTVMLSPITEKGKRLRESVEQFRTMLTSMTDDTLQQTRFNAILSTRSQSNREGVKKNWEEQKFENMPAIAAITLLSQIQNDIRYTEGETLTQLLNNTDAGDLRVNEMEAMVLPRSQMVMRGSQYVAEIVLAAVDSTQRPTITAGGEQLEAGKNIYSVTATGSGEVKYDGTVTVEDHDGNKSVYPFSSSYYVLDPMATVSATMMNVLYCGIDNPLSISVPGVPQSSVSATMTGGTLKRDGNNWIAHPAPEGTEAEITVTADIEGTRRQMAKHKFKVRRLPDPQAYITYNDASGQPQEYRGGTPLARTALASARGLGAAIDDDVLNIAFNVTGFETVFFDSMGNAMPEISNGADFSQRQKDAFKRLGHGKRFYITKIKAQGPDGTERNLPPIEVIVQ